MLKKQASNHCGRIVRILFIALFAICASGAKGALLASVTDDSLNVTTDSAEAGAVAPDSTAQRKEPFQRLKKTGSWLKRFIRGFNDYDTEYITPNYYNYTVMLQNTNFHQIYQMKATSEDDVTQKLQMSPSPGFKLGPYFGWRWLFFGYTFDLGHPKSAGKSTEFSLSVYSSQIGADFVWIRNKGDFTMRRVKGFSDEIAHSVKGREFNGMDADILSLNAYYIFNHRHFSYPAAYSQSTVQRKSCGSWILGFTYSKQKISFDYTRLPSELITPTNGTEEIPLIDELKFSKINYQSFSFNGGYAYNWVFARNCLFSISFTPSVGFKKSKGERLKGKDWLTSMRKFSFDFVGRSGLVWNNSHYFAGASLISHFYDYQGGTYTMRNFINYVNIYVGFMFNKKRQYRNGARR